MKKILNILIITFPYLICLLTILTFTSGENFLFPLLALIILLGLFFISFISVVIDMFLKWKTKKVLSFALSLKLVYIPIHIVLFLITGGMGSPFLFWLMPVPLAISYFLLCMTSIISTIVFLKKYKEKNYKLSKTIIYSLLSYSYILDIVIMLITYIQSEKE